MSHTSNPIYFEKLDLWHDTGLNLARYQPIKISPDEIIAREDQHLIMWALDLGYRSHLELDECTNPHKENQSDTLDAETTN